LLHGPKILLEKFKQKGHGGAQGVGPEERFEKWTEDGQALPGIQGDAVGSTDVRLEVPTGKRTLLQTVDPSERAGAVQEGRRSYAEGSKTYIYSTVRSLGTLRVVEGLE
jgi:hypothetical protein